MILWLTIVTLLRIIVWWLNAGLKFLHVINQFWFHHKFGPLWTLEGLVYVIEKKSVSTDISEAWRWVMNLLEVRLQTKRNDWLKVLCWLLTWSTDAHETVSHDELLFLISISLKNLDPKVGWFWLEGNICFQLSWFIIDRPKSCGRFRILLSACLVHCSSGSSETGARSLHQFSRFSPTEKVVVKGTEQPEIRESMIIDTNKGL